MESKKKILIIEDEPPILEILSGAFSKNNFLVFQAGDGEMGLAKALEEKPDIILLDIILPKMDGLTLLKKLRNENSYGKNVPVILLTNLNPSGEKINQAITEDALAYYMVKANWSVGDIVEKVRERLSIA